MKRLEGRIALVTGSSRGIGAAIARKLASEGARVVIHARSQRDRADAVAEVIRAAGGSADVVMGDLATGETALEVVRAAHAIHGALDVLVLNAGGGKGGLAADMPLETVDAVLALNLRATILAASEFARLTASEAGRIVFISSGMATHPAPGVSIGAAAKAGAEAFMRSLAQELGPRGITCNSVAPGCTRTEMIAGQSWPDQVVPWTALRRLGEPEDIAEVVGFLASDEGRWITGQTIAANGGLVTTAANILARAQ
ncbi:SDR family NAD(P)-dependent oxidoreductase [Novosphingobium album (ex Hu et al. 2023)]|uniref:SDR family oxidoreductase n=1 Tax=Novosphingobium album (ex Hu et al. 2023) TaxID=2930093 RepID=A0ABT0B2V8_9SPHN|nr:SDR family oxidoreductase [Novosphingobium album (ex Hu et al. 2023)]MCJ2179375.1 SDR family oxidoreductase [Novosphingobium album (ex Hu et al. 2023)]